MSDQLEGEFLGPEELNQNPPVSEEIGARPFIPGHLDKKPTFRTYFSSVLELFPPFYPDTADKLVLPPHFSKIDELNRCPIASLFADFHSWVAFASVRWGKTAQNRPVFPPRWGKKFKKDGFWGAECRKKHTSQDILNPIQSDHSNRVR